MLGSLAAYPIDLITLTPMYIYTATTHSHKSTQLWLQKSKDCWDQGIGSTLWYLVFKDDLQ